MRPIRQWTVHNVWEQNARWTTTTVCSFRACLWRVVNCPVSTYCISNLECISSYLLVHTVVLLPTYNLQYDSMIHFQQCSRWFKVHTYNIRYWHRDMWLIKIWPFMSFGMLMMDGWMYEKREHTSYRTFTPLRSCFCLFLMSSNQWPTSLTVFNTRTNSTTTTLVVYNTGTVLLPVRTRSYLPSYQSVWISKAGEDGRMCHMVTYLIGCTRVPESFRILVFVWSASRERWMGKRGQWLFGATSGFFEGFVRSYHTHQV